MHVGESAPTPPAADAKAAGGDEGETDDAAEWSVEFSMLVTMSACAASISLIVAGWAWLCGPLVPLGLAVLPAWRWWVQLFSGGAPFVTTNHAKTKLMVQLALAAPHLEKGAAKAVAADLGSGDGRLAIALARAGVGHVHGFEINWALVQYSRLRVARAGLQDRVTIHWQSMWTADLSQCDVVTTYQHTLVMGRLEEKLRSELKPEARVVSNSFRFPTWEPEAVISGGGDAAADGGGEGGGSIMLYTKSGTKKQE